MKRIVFVLLLLVVGCKGKEGATGPTGPRGNSGDAIPSHQVFFQPGQLPAPAWSGVTLMNVDIQNPTTAYSDNGTIRLAPSAYPVGNPRRILMRFNILDYVPQNAQVTSAVLQLTSLSTSSFSGAAVTLGLFDLSNSTLVDTGSCIWNQFTTWVAFDGATYWTVCGGSGTTGFDRGTQYPQDPMDTLVIPVSASGSQYLWAWNITPSIVQKWLNYPAKNNGLLVSSVNEWMETASGSIVFGVVGSAASTRPTLIVDYYIP